MQILGLTSLINYKYVLILLFEYFLPFSASRGVSPNLTLNLTSLCAKEAVFQVYSKDTLPKIKCDLTYSGSKESGDNEKKVTVELNKDGKITVFPDNGTLHEKLFNVKLQCGKDWLSKTLPEMSGSCTDNTEPTTPGSDVVFKSREIFSSSITDIVLGIVFSIVAILIVSITAYYQFRKYQRRRRMQQYLSTPHTDPFESLQDHMEG